MQILYGKEVENHLSKTITEKLNLLREKNKIPKLAILRVGKNGNDIS
ncbi:MAG: bifunctional 5,10-methylenetetrahydrofolate dehydrogenase/5,10-methenyltetrahydrofolate cyclohydrolase, partial [Lachnospiraceae bacterium]